MGASLGAGDPMLTVLPWGEGGRTGAWGAVRPLLVDRSTLRAGGARAGAGAFAAAADEAEVYGPRVAEAPSGTDDAALVVSSQSSRNELGLVDKVGGMAPGLAGIAVLFGGGFDILMGNDASQRLEGDNKKIRECDVERWARQRRGLSAKWLCTSE